MTLYSSAESNIHKTWLLITFFLVLVIALGWLFSYLLNNQWILVAAVVFAVFQSFLSYWYSDKIILSMVHAHPISKKDNLELYRIVENLCITAGLPLPKIYIMDEAQPNAFATGRDPKHSAIVFTKGLLDILERDEIEGVASHELSHVKNRDILLSSVVVVLVGVIVLAANWFLRISFWGGMGRRDRNSNNGNLLMLLGILAAVLAPLAAILIKSAISRKREFLADASGALLTRYPEGLERALEKISQSQTPMRAASNSTAHLFIASPFRGKQKNNWFTKLFMTHPPVEERIKALKGIKI